MAGFIAGGDERGWELVHSTTVNVFPSVWRSYFQLDTKHIKSMSLVVLSKDNTCKRLKAIVEEVALTIRIEKSHGLEPVSHPANQPRHTSIQCRHSKMER
jgi:hypothetical protein